MTDQSALLRAFADYARTLLRNYDIGEVLYRLTDQVVEILGVDGAGVFIADTGDILQFLTATDDRVAHVEEAQIDIGEGPCHDAYRSGDRVTSADLTSDDRWPRYRPAALGRGFRAVAGIPMVAEDQRIGALNLYHRTPREWPADHLEVAHVLADMTTGYVVNARTLSAQRELTTQLQHALDSRIVIEQAKGILAERHTTDPSSAFQMLRLHARSRNLKLHEIARRVVDGSLQVEPFEARPGRRAPSRAWQPQDRRLPRPQWGQEPEASPDPL